MNQKRSGRSNVRWVRWCITLVVPLTVVVAGCGPASIALTFDNRTDVTLCQYSTPEDAALQRCRTELEPQAETGSGRDCNNNNSRQVTVIITVKDGGREIYNRKSTCGELNDNGRFIIEQQGEEFVVTDSLPP